MFDEKSLLVSAKETREALGLTQEQFAKLLKKGTSTVQRYENQVPVSGIDELAQFYELALQSGRKDHAHTFKEALIRKMDQRVVRVLLSNGPSKTTSPRTDGDSIPIGSMPPPDIVAVCEKVLTTLNEATNAMRQLSPTLQTVEPAVTSLIGQLTEALDGGKNPALPRTEKQLHKRLERTQRIKRNAKDAGQGDTGASADKDRSGEEPGKKIS